LTLIEKSLVPAVSARLATRMARTANYNAITLSKTKPKEINMSPRLNFASPDAMKAMVTLENSVSKLDLEPSLLELVKLRAAGR
jgi:hypothetical protein